MFFRAKIGYAQLFCNALPDLQCNIPVIWSRSFSVKIIFIFLFRNTIHGHNEFSAKACPCFDVKKELAPYFNKGSEE